MLRIAAIGNSYPHVKRFVEYKFKDKIDKIIGSHSLYILKNGDEVHLCYDEQSKNRYLSMMYDAFVVAPKYVSLLDVIRSRCERSL